MKKLYYFLVFTIALGCTTTTTEEEIEVVSLEDNVVRIEVLTGEPNSDELQISYYEYETDSFSWQPYTVSYDTSGNPLPVIINFDDYDFRYINGEVYRNNSNPASINLKIFLNNEIIIDETEEGDGTEQVLIRFNYDIKNKKSI